MPVPTITSIVARGGVAPGNPPNMSSSTLNQTVGSTGVSLVITGTGFTNATSVSYGSGFLLAGTPTKTLTTITIPNVTIGPSGPYTITLTNGPGEVATGTMTVYQPATISTTVGVYSPSDVMINVARTDANMYLVIAGNNFVQGSYIRVNNGSPLSTVFLSESRIYAPIKFPTLGGTLNVSVENISASAPSKVISSLVVENPKPTIANVTSTSARGTTNATINITGTGFKPGAAVTFGGNLIKGATSSTTVGSNGSGIVVSNVIIGLSGPYTVQVTNPSPTRGASDVFSATFSVPKALTTTPMGLTQPLLASGAGRIIPSVNVVSLASTNTFSVDGSNTVIFIKDAPATLSGASLNLSTTGAVTGDIITMFAKKGFKLNGMSLFVRQQKGSVVSDLHDVFVSDTDTFWASFIFIEGDWYLYQSV